MHLCYKHQLNNIHRNFERKCIKNETRVSKGQEIYWKALMYIQQTFRQWRKQMGRTDAWKYNAAEINVFECPWFLSKINSDKKGKFFPPSFLSLIFLFISTVEMGPRALHMLG